MMKQKDFRGDEDICKWVNKNKIKVISITYCGNCKLFHVYYDDT